MSGRYVALDAANKVKWTPGTAVKKPPFQLQSFIGSTILHPYVGVHQVKVAGPPDYLLEKDPTIANR
eukprot:8177870-Karenia_brevis.AAC.1